MRRTLVAAALAVATLATTLGPPAAATLAGTGPTTAAAPSGVDALLAVDRAAWAPLDVVATFGRQPTDAVLDALRSLGLGVTPLRTLPLARLVGLRPALAAALGTGLVRDLYANEALELLDEASNEVVTANRTRRAGLDGRGVTVAVVDSGVDGAHPALDRRMLRNFKILGREQLNVVSPDQPPDPALVIPVDQLPYDTSDTTVGHGTHVAGIVAADGTGDASLVGVAPGARLVGYGTGDVLFIWHALAAYDHLLRNRRELRIRVVNNSWGSGYREFDPDHPINVATKAAHDAGVTVVFSAGNSTHHGTINPYSVAPWVISVAAATTDSEISSFSSGGLPHDNAVSARLAADSHVAATGDRIGLYHPDVTAPGTDIRSAGTPLGIGVLAPSAPGGTTVLSGTSMSAPHVAGAVAVLLQARPSPTPDQVRHVLQVTATPLRDGTDFTPRGTG